MDGRLGILENKAMKLVISTFFSLLLIGFVGISYNQFWLDASIDHGGYLGMQAGGIINGQRVGKILIVSAWNASNATAEGAATDCKGVACFLRDRFCLKI